jgi:hypothetical protein
MTPIYVPPGVKINPNAFGAAEPAPDEPKPQARLWVRSIPEIAHDLVGALSYSKPGLLLELRESFQNDWEMWQSPGATREPLAMAHRNAGEQVWETIAEHLGLPEVSGGGYR